MTPNIPLKETEQVKPCPFCGEKPLVEDQDNFTLCCIDGDWYLSKESWNNAYCWKELSKSQSTIEELRVIIAELVGALCYYHNPLEHAARTNNSQCHQCNLISRAKKAEGNE